MLGCIGRRLSGSISKSRSKRLPLPHKLSLGQRAWLGGTTSTKQTGRRDQGLATILLRDYQEECIQSALAALGGGHKRLGISLATGAGKTVIFTQLIDRVRPASDYATQTLILAHRRELVQQAANHCINAYPEKAIDIELGSLHASGTADITVASVQSITSGDRLLKFDPKRFKLVLVDEAHHIVSPQYLRVLAHFGLDVKKPDSPSLVGVSATFSRFDGLRLGTAIDEIVYHRDYVDLIKHKWLSDVIFTSVESTADISRVRSGANKDFQPADLSSAVNTDHVNEVTVRSWLAKAAGRHSTLVFCVDRAHVSGLTAKFREHGVEAHFITGDTPQVERSSRLDAFKRREFPVLVNCGVFTEGTDIPGIDCVVLARPTKSRNLLIQMIGRGVRRYPGKENCHIIDMVSSLKTGIVTTPTLFGLDPGELLNNASADDMRDLRDQRAGSTGEEGVNHTGPADRHDSGPQKVAFTEYDSVFDLIADTSGEKHIRALSQFAWVQAGADRWILSGPTGTYLRLERCKESKAPAYFTAYVIRVLPTGVAKSPYAAPQKLLDAATLEDAVHGCDEYASRIFPFAFISLRQQWREGPPTQSQLDFINKLRGKDGKTWGRDITKGQAMDMITKIKHGARGRFADMEADRRRHERKNLAAEQVALLRRRETVSVGPVLN